jgi:hypothetical protein
MKLPAIVCVQLFLAAAILLSLNAQAQRMAVVSSGGPIFVVPDENRTPLTVVRDGSTLTLLRIEGDWYQVEFVDDRFGKRNGYIHKKYLKAALVASAAAPPPNPREPAASATSVNGVAATTPTTAAPARPASLPEAAPSTTPTVAVNRVPANRQQYPLVEFKDAKVREQQGDKTADIDARLQYGSDALVIAKSNSTPQKPAILKTLKYSDITGAEYTFGKSPRVSAAVFVSPFFLMNSSKSHWLTVKAAGDYALLRLDKSNYKLVLAELEKRSGVKVESIGEDK